MTNFQFYTYELPCFNCYTRKVKTDLGWLTPSMKTDIIDQIEVMLKQQGNDYKPYFTVQVVCTVDEAKDYLLLNYYDNSESEINHGNITPTVVTEIEDQITEHMTAEGVVIFSHEIELQNCDDCFQENDE
ncbi:hypothetical protein [Photobacterium carnosum]|jgi:hypothetical protein|uniref:Uncharacterized protein n=1 Tax=Photobacterium carnosum TaxID=2023717 RepID=A0A2N4UWU7_9GAMM|nr:hypothetical protein [Photobacterium carnosum]KAE8178609.1 hypothetical protein CIT27_02265 [Photobacterium carnosum]MBY3786909.1 hypothetical protein [Photobacterium carnosum]MCD9493917.1 hypothetical protein [Photobacterium carnosum]MCD9497632.1 hypothetical protein [Photobacterium carnosum]MCD9515402.1 hypothetical protein [Photobacterium carnosum]